MEVDFRTRINCLLFPKGSKTDERAYGTVFSKKKRPTSMESRTEMRQRLKNNKLEKTLDDIFYTFKDEPTKLPPTDDIAIMRKMLMSTIRNVRTPTDRRFDEGEDQKELAVITLQKIIRGRSTQITLREEIEEHMWTLLELKNLHKMDPNGLHFTVNERIVIKNLQREITFNKEKRNEITQVPDQLEGETLSRMMEFLEKEMIRLLDEKRIHNVMTLADHNRRFREAVEAGRRQMDEEFRRSCDEIHRQVTGIHQSTVDIHLDELYLESLNRNAEESTKGYIQNLAKAYNNAAYMMNNATEIEQEEMIDEMIQGFLLPEMNRFFARENEANAKKRTIIAAQQVTGSLCSAQGILNEIVGALQPTMKYHMNIGEKSVKGAKDAIDCIMREAVRKAYKLPNSEFDKIGKAPEEDAGEGETPERDSDDDFGEDDEKIPECRADCSGIEVPPILATALGEKSLQLAHHSEIGEKTLNIFKEACETFFELAIITADKVAPPPEEVFDDEMVDD